MEQKIIISPEALIEWKEKCSADKCSEQHKYELIKRSFQEWRRYTSSYNMWGMKSEKGEKTLVKSSSQELFSEELYDNAVKYNKENPSKSNSDYILHPFQEMEKLLYKNMPTIGKSYKSHLLSNAKYVNNDSAFIRILFHQYLFRDFIKKQELEFVNSISFDDKDKKIDIDEPYIEDNHIDNEELKLLIKDIFAKSKELEKVSYYYFFKGFENSRNKLSLEQITNITGKKKVFYDYKQNLVKSLKDLCKQGYLPRNIIKLSSKYIKIWAKDSSICLEFDRLFKEIDKKNSSSVGK